MLEEIDFPFTKKCQFSDDFSVSLNDVLACKNINL